MLHVNLCVAVITVALCCILLRSHIPASSLPSLPLGRLLYTESAAFVCLVGPSSHSRNRTRGLQLMLQTLQINYQVDLEPTLAQRGAGLLHTTSYRPDLRLCDPVYATSVLAANM